MAVAGLLIWNVNMTLSEVNTWYSLTTDLLLFMLCCPLPPVPCAWEGPLRWTQKLPPSSISQLTPACAELDSVTPVHRPDQVTSRFLMFLISACAIQENSNWFGWKYWVDLSPYIGRMSWPYVKTLRWLLTSLDFTLYRESWLDDQTVQILI